MVDNNANAGVECGGGAKYAAGGTELGTSPPLVAPLI